MDKGAVVGWLMLMDCFHSHFHNFMSPPSLHPNLDVSMCDVDLRSTRPCRAWNLYPQWWRKVGRWLSNVSLSWNVEALWFCVCSQPCNAYRCKVKKVGNRVSKVSKEGDTQASAGFFLIARSFSLAKPVFQSKSHQLSPYETFTTWRTASRKHHFGPETWRGCPFLKSVIEKV